MRLYYIVKIIQICFILMAMAAIIYIDPFCDQDPLDKESFENHLNARLSNPANHNHLDNGALGIGFLEKSDRSDDTNIIGINSGNPENIEIIERATAKADEANSNILTRDDLLDSMMPDGMTIHPLHVDRTDRDHIINKNHSLEADSSILTNLTAPISSETTEQPEITSADLNVESTPDVVETDPVTVPFTSDVSSTETKPEQKKEDDFHNRDNTDAINLPTNDKLVQDEVDPESAEDTGDEFTNSRRRKRDVEPEFNLREPININRTIVGTFRCEKIDIWSVDGMLTSSGNIYQDVAARRHFASIGLFAHLIVALYHLLCHCFTKVPFSNSSNRVIAVFSAFIWICIGSWSLFEYISWTKTFANAPFKPDIPPFYVLILLYSIIAILILAIEIVDHKSLFANIAVDEVLPTGYNRTPQTEAEYIESVIEQIEMANVAPENRQFGDFGVKKNGIRMKALNEI